MVNVRLTLPTLAALFATSSIMPAWADDLSGAHDFDFEFGDWTVHHRSKRPNGVWKEFDGTSQTRPILDGLGNVEEHLFHRAEGDSRGVAIRAYDPKTAS